MNRGAKQTAALVIGMMLMTTGWQAFAKKPKPTPVSGEAVFKQNCASCHTGGGNTANPKKPLAGSQKLTNFPLFKSYLENPVGHMPYYKHVVSDKKTMKALYEYCKTLKAGEGA